MWGRSGFTLVETLVVLVLALVVSATAHAGFTTIAAAMQVSASARTLAQTLRATRSRAIAEGIALDAFFDDATQTWGIRAPDGTVRTTSTLPSPVRFASLPVRRRVRFGSTGSAENGTITVSATGRAKSVVVNQRGRVRLQ
jgi:prepilin-type N-terminal cleavage/methylation domain-containing protein